MAASSNDICKVYPEKQHFVFQIKKEQTFFKLLADLM